MILKSFKLSEISTVRQNWFHACHTLECSKASWELLLDFKVKYNNQYIYMSKFLLKPSLVHCLEFAEEWLIKQGGISESYNTCMLINVFKIQTSISNKQDMFSG